jgi:release factor glutamine methyltransferase
VTGCGLGFPEVYERLLDAAALLSRGGTLAVEVGRGQADEVRARFARRADLTAIEVRADLAGVPRVVSAKRAR